MKERKERRGRCNKQEKHNKHQWWEAKRKCLKIRKAAHTFHIESDETREHITVNSPFCDVLSKMVLVKHKCDLGSERE